MEFFGIGGAELIVIIVLAAVVLGPRRLVLLAREAGQLARQFRDLSRKLARQLDREMYQAEAAERRSRARALAASPPGPPAERPAPDTAGEASLPEAYRRFRADFPDEGVVDAVPKDAAADPAKHRQRPVSGA